MTTEGVVVHVIDGYSAVVNKGDANFTVEGAQCIIYSLGDELKDPVTGDSLGRLEIVKAKGKIAHVQQKMSIIEADEPRKKDQYKSLNMAMGIRTEVDPFSRVNPGDFVRIFD